MLPPVETTVPPVIAALTDGCVPDLAVMVAAALAPAEFSPVENEPALAVAVELAARMPSTAMSPSAVAVVSPVV